MNKFREQFRRYAELLVRRGMNVQPGQEVVVAGEMFHAPLMRMVMEEGYRAGAKSVSLELIDPLADRIHIENAPAEGLAFIPKHIAELRNELVESQGAVVRFDGMENPDLYASVDPSRINAVQTARRKARDEFYEGGINRRQVQWCVACAATPGWGLKLFPGEDPSAAEALLWEELFKLLRVDTPDYLDRWSKHDEALHRRAETLNEMQVQELHFTGGGTDLRVRLSPNAYFGGGSKKSARGVPFIANLPTEEVFTTPDCRATEGTAVITRPVIVNQTLVRDLVLTFKNGTITDFRASSGESAFRSLIDTDEGARRLGEVALVGIDSPIYQSGLVFQEILLDENACCHIAVGSAYKNKLRGSEQMSAEDLELLGCNNSVVHVDFMISSEQTFVSARRADGSVTEIISNGKWNV